MEDLPLPLVAEILSHLSDSADFSRCCIVSKTLNAAASETYSLNHFCTLSHYLSSRSRNLSSPFKPSLVSLVTSLPALRSLSISVDKSLALRSYDYVEDDLDDLYLTDGVFLAEWVPFVGAGLRSLVISDFWSQSSWRKSEALAQISSFCCNLLELEVKNAWLSVDGLNPMPKLTNLTLEFIRLDDEDLDRVNECFPCLQVLNLIGVGVLKDPKIELVHLKICHWTISNAPTSLTILAPSLVELRLECVRPRSLVLDTPSLSDLYLKLVNANDFKVKDFPHLKRLNLMSCNLCSLMGKFGPGRSVEMLALDVPKRIEPVAPNLSFRVLFDLFPNVSLLKLGPGSWLEMEAVFCRESLEGTMAVNCLKEIIIHLVIHDMNSTLSFISSILDRFTNLSGMGVLFHSNADSVFASKFMTKCRTVWPRVRWRWGFSKEGTNDRWISDAN